MALYITTYHPFTHLISSIEEFNGFMELAVTGMHIITEEGIDIVNEIISRQDKNSKVPIEVFQECFIEKLHKDARVVISRDNNLSVYHRFEFLILPWGGIEYYEKVDKQLLKNLIKSGLINRICGSTIHIKKYKHIEELCEYKKINLNLVKYKYPQYGYDIDGLDLGIITLSSCSELVVKDFFSRVGSVHKLHISYKHVKYIPIHFKVTKLIIKGEHGISCNIQNIADNPHIRYLECGVDIVADFSNNDTLFRCFDRRTVEIMTDLTRTNRENSEKRRFARVKPIMS